LTYVGCAINLLPFTEIDTMLSILVANGLSNGIFSSELQTPPAAPTGSEPATLIGLG